jgi:mannose-6-phosphate isomerase-like protein (cupin superfamily)
MDELSDRLRRTEADLRARGYRTERATAHPGYMASNQTFSDETLILVLFGELVADCQEQTLRLGPGGHLHVPAGIPYQLRVGGEQTVYWIQAHRPEQRPGGQRSPGSRKT